MLNMYTIFVLEKPTSLPSPNVVPDSPERLSVIAGTHNALESMASLLTPIATIGVLVYGFRTMFRGITGSASSSGKMLA